MNLSMLVGQMAPTPPAGGHLSETDSRSVVVHFLRSPTAQGILETWLRDLQAALEVQGFGVVRKLVLGVGQGAAQEAAQGVTATDSEAYLALTADVRDPTTAQELSLTAWLRLPVWARVAGQCALGVKLVAKLDSSVPDEMVSSKEVALSPPLVLKDEMRRAGFFLTKHVKEGLEKVSRASLPRALDEFVAEVCARQSQ